MPIGINILRPDSWDTACARFVIKSRGIVYAGRNPRTFSRAQDHFGDSRMLTQPWVIRHPECEGKLYKAVGIETYALFSIREGAPIGVMVREWDESVDGPIELNEWQPTDNTAPS